LSYQVQGPSSSTFQIIVDGVLFSSEGPSPVHTSKRDGGAVSYIPLSAGQHEILLNYHHSEAMMTPMMRRKLNDHETDYHGVRPHPFDPSLYCDAHI